MKHTKKIVLFFTILAWLPNSVHGLLRGFPKRLPKSGLTQQDNEFVPERGQWQLDLNGNLKASELSSYPTTMLSLHPLTPFPCTSCACSFIDRKGVATHCDMEINSRIMVARWLPENATVLEVGARYGSNSCAMASKQKQSGKLVVVDADARVWDALEMNRKTHNCNFHTVHGVIGRTDAKIKNEGYGTLAAPEATPIENLPSFTTKDLSQNPDIGVSKSVVPHFTLNDVQTKYNLKFDAANFDCEGCLPYVLKDFPEFPAQLKLLIIEAHDKNELAVVSQLLTKGWEIVDRQSRQYVLTKANADAQLQANSHGKRSQESLLVDEDKTCMEPVSVAIGFRANVGQSCEKVCAIKNMQCNPAGMKKLNTEASVKDAFHRNGRDCKHFTDVNLAGYWAGPLVTNDAQCAYNSNPEWEPNCRGKTTCGSHLGCSCH